MVATSLKQLCQICFHCVEFVLLVKPVILECFDALFKTGNDWILTIRLVIVVLRVKKKINCYPVNQRYR